MIISGFRYYSIFALKPPVRPDSRRTIPPPPVIPFAGRDVIDTGFFPFPQRRCFDQEHRHFAVFPAQFLTGLFFFQQQIFHGKNSVFQLQILRILPLRPVQVKQLCEKLIPGILIRPFWMRKNPASLRTRNRKKESCISQPSGGLFSVRVSIFRAP